jgi:hypothetical protein
MLCGVLLSLVNLGILSLLLVILAGYLVGEAVSLASRRLPYRGLAVLAFACASLGPSLGRAALLAAMIPMPDPALRATLAVTAAFQSLGAFGLLAAVVAGVIASNRVTRF